MSGLLNVIDGVGSEEGKLFFATTNYIDRLDAALLRPGRIDRKIEYRLATQEQAKALYTRFYPDSRMPEFDIEDQESLSDFAERFAGCIPPDEFSTAELQGYLLGHKKAPGAAMHGIDEWIAAQRRDRMEKAEREKKKRERMEVEMRKRQAMMPGMAMPSYSPPFDVY